ncbi:hypothetical protein NTGHW29_140120 [Candidatus Nitrotoga sp. HW29]|uniref:hypothetical protein n=1 Tax=Candidatus Nitrotoga sp. HW29 TaxID=2886963 RepID=UPI001EF167C3|nr:hypothetical protein [Candidatus Nitrotoga sp. HW29]CAH1903745.1 hypothetical protein NTGHW29_140120 [Candidatus Nitrotoga sp. HW29]
MKSVRPPILKMATEAPTGFDEITNEDLPHGRTTTLNALTVHSVAEWLIDWLKATGITLVCTSLLNEMPSQSEGSSSLQISNTYTTNGETLMGTLREQKEGTHRIANEVNEIARTQTVLHTWNLGAVAL